MSRYADGPCTRTEADDDDADRYPEYTAPKPSTTAALRRELRHFRDMARIESHEPTSALWTSLADQIDAYINPTASHDEPALFAHTTEATP